MYLELGEKSIPHTLDELLKLIIADAYMQFIDDHVIDMEHVANILLDLYIHEESGAYKINDEIFAHNNNSYEIKKILEIAEIYWDEHTAVGLKIHEYRHLAELIKRIIDEQDLVKIKTDNPKVIENFKVPSG